MRICGLCVVLAVAGCGRLGYNENQLGSEVDATSPVIDGGTGGDGAPAANPCPAQLDSVVALYDFDSEGLTDSTGSLDGFFSGGTLGFGPSRDGCGRALEFPTAEGAFVAVADAPAWDLPIGSLDFWVRFDVDSAAGFIGILSRDAGGQADPGHIGVYRIQDGSIVVRVQNNGSVVLCANTSTSEGVWTHVGINFGAPVVELFVDGVLSTRTDPIVFDSPVGNPIMETCGGTATWGIDGNDNPWMIGVNGSRTNEGVLTPIPGEWFRDGAIDHIRISSVRRDY